MLHDVADGRAADHDLHVDVDRGRVRVGGLDVRVETAERRVRDGDNELPVDDLDGRAGNVAHRQAVEHADRATVRVDDDRVRRGVHDDAHDRVGYGREARGVRHAAQLHVRLEARWDRHLLSARDGVHHTVGRLDVRATGGIDGHQERRSADGGGRTRRPHLVLRARRERARDDVPGAAEVLAHLHHDVAARRRLERLDDELAVRLHLDGRAVVEREDRVRVVAGPHDVTLEEQIAVAALPELRAVMAHRDDPVEDLERARRRGDTRWEEHAEQSGRDDDERDDQRGEHREPEWPPFR